MLNHKRFTFIAFFLLLTVEVLFAQAPRQWTSGDIHQAIKKLNFLGSALYVAAHPDDENTQLIAYLSNEVKANTAYLSMTRGDGGQNLIGPEIRELLGIIRTQELLAARRTDGGTQFFTRANDFGYSKHPDETFKIWNKDKVLADVVWTMRKWRPDVIINRFDHRTPGSTHGHHTGSAMLSFEAFDLAGDPKAYPEQLQYVDTWQPKRLFFNTSWWFFGSQEAFEKADKSKFASVDVGVYYPTAGKSNPEISAESRSMHKSQGFGSSGRRGSTMEYAEIIKGDFAGNTDDLFAGINTSWTRVKGGGPIGELLNKIDQSFADERPAKSIPDLIKVYRMIKALPDGYWRTVKLEETKTVIKACLGLFAEAVAEDFWATPGEEIAVDLEVINRSAAKVILKKIVLQAVPYDTSLNLELANNQVHQFTKQLHLPKDLAFTTPYWLTEPADLGMYTVKDQRLRGLPETPRDLKVAFELLIEGEPITYETAIVYKRTDPVAGEVYRPFELVPPVFANIHEPVYIFEDQEPKEISVLLKAGQAGAKGTLALELPEGWRSEPQQLPFALEQKGQELAATFKVFAPEEQSEGKLMPVITLEDGSTYNKELVLIEYDHIPTQTILKDAVARVVKVNLKKEGNRIGYIPGAGDAIPQSLEQIGYEVTLLDDADLTPENLRNFDAVIMGIRAYNVNDRLKFHQQKLLDYVKEGGTMIVQYNTTRGLSIPAEQLGPYPLKLSRDRVTVEEAEVRFLKPDHPVLNFPNKITQKDFEGWVQERGLYFPNEWDDAYDAILSSNDPGEEPSDGGLLVASYGKGYYIYSGYSWFRELPAGVPGAFRLFANMISIGKAPRP